MLLLIFVLSGFFVVVVFFLSFCDVFSFRRIVNWKSVGVYQANERVVTTHRFRSQFVQNIYPTWYMCKWVCCCLFAYIFHAYFLCYLGAEKKANSRFPMSKRTFGPVSLTIWGISYIEGVYCIRCALLRKVGNRNETFFFVSTFVIKMFVYLLGSRFLWPYSFKRWNNNSTTSNTQNCHSEHLCLGWMRARVCLFV